jgi:hypothetical protein
VKLDDVGWKSKFVILHELTQQLQDVESLVGLPIALFTKTIFMTLNTPNTNVKELNDFFGKKLQV